MKIFIIIMGSLFDFILLLTNKTSSRKKKAEK